MYFISMAISSLLTLTTSHKHFAMLKPYIQFLFFCSRLWITHILETLGPGPENIIQNPINNYNASGCRHLGSQEWTKTWSVG